MRISSLKLLWVTYLSFTSYFSFEFPFGLNSIPQTCAFRAISFHKMKPSHLQTLLCYSLPLLASASGCGTCIADNEAHEIAKRWLGAFASDGLPKLPEAVTENVCHIFLDHIGRLCR